MQVVAHYGNIMDSKFSVQFFEQFDVVSESHSRSLLQLEYQVRGDKQQFWRYKFGCSILAVPV